jgi:predicted transcriptional regulator
MPTTGPGRRPPGELETSVLSVLWSAGAPLTPAQVQQSLGDGLARTTVTTILTRLHEKGVLLRSRVGRAFAYAPAQGVRDAPGLAARRMHSELEKEQDRQTVLARFVSSLSEDDERLLRSLLGTGASASGSSTGSAGSLGSMGSIESSAASGSAGEM